MLKLVKSSGGKMLKIFGSSGGKVCSFRLFLGHLCQRWGNNS